VLIRWREGYSGCVCGQYSVLGTDEAYIHELAIKLRGQGVLLEQEGDAAGLLGVQMTMTEEGLLEMK
jgi:hypothetical protein